jgi:hypothetical protein
MPAHASASYGTSKAHQDDRRSIRVNGAPTLALSFFIVAEVNPTFHRS